jgi:hypothetical protein
VNDVVAGTGIDRVLEARAASHDVVTSPGADEIAAAQGVDHVITTEAGDDIVTLGPADAVVTLGPRDRDALTLALPSPGTGR